MSEYHIPALLSETIEALAIKANGTYVDVTFGGGGHSREILKNLKTGRLIAFDQDTDALENSIDDERFLLVNHNFRFIKNFLDYYDVDQVDGILGDLGVSSHHFDEPERGFSFRFDGPLDMRMNTEAGLSAAHILNNYSKEELLKVFQVYGEIPRAGRMVHLILNYREKKVFKRTGDLIEAIESLVPPKNESKYLAKVFQGLRIEANRELEVLIEFLNQSVALMKPGGRLAIITYHSLEDRIVKNFFRSGNIEGKVEKDLFGNPIAPLRPVNKKVIIPTDEEIKINNRIRSAKLRVAEKVAVNE